ncbi:MAG: hypothetical protein Q7K40_01235 [bacterium]|nr:hypothetical protein [bacterium]
MTFNLASVDREVDRLFWKESGLAITKYCLERYDETGDKFFLVTAKEIATDHKKLNDLYIHNGGADVSDELFNLIMALEDVGEPTEIGPVASVEDLFQALLAESEKETVVVVTKAYRNKNLPGNPF